MTGAALPIVILAAGMSSRMRGADKLLQEVRGAPLLLDRVRMAVATGHPVLVTLPPREDAPERWACLADEPVAVIEVLDRHEGIAHSIAAGFDALPDGAIGAMILLADLPNLTTEDLLTVFDEFDGESILRGETADGMTGHPVLVPMRDFAQLRALTGDEGAKALLKANKDRVRPVSLPFNHARLDLDTPEDWAIWRRHEAQATGETSAK